MDKSHLMSIRIAEKVFFELNEFVKPGISEKEAAKEIRKRLKKHGAKKESFRIIVASGKRAAKIHGFAHTRKLRENDIIMFDFGALYKGWRSDITRTYVLGVPTKLQIKRYAMLKNAQMAGIKKIKAGIKCSDVDRAVRDSLKKKGYDKFFVHSTGHGVGKKTHQSPKISAKNDNILKAGDVVTIEPGIYLKRWGGMRIEDMVLVTRKGHKILTNVNRSLTL